MTEKSGKVSGRGQGLDRVKQKNMGMYILGNGMIDAWWIGKL